MPETGTEIVASNSQQGLTPQQEAFVAALMRGAALEEAASEAGRPGDGLSLAIDPIVQSAIEARSRAFLITLIPTALAGLNALASHAGPADRARIEALKAVLAMAGFVPPMRERAKPRQANLADMRNEDLRALVDQLTGELAARATPVGEPKRATTTRDLTDLLA